MSSKCRNTNSDVGVYVESYSGVGTTDVCTLAGRTDVKHIVTVKNLRLYDAEVSCRGIISSVPNQVEFSGTQQGITPQKWSSTGSILADNEERTFDHVFLKSVGSGSENVRAEVDVTWPENNRKSNISVPITVTV